MKSGEEEEEVDGEEEREEEEGGEKAKQERKPGLKVFEFILLGFQGASRPSSIWIVNMFSLRTLKKKKSSRILKKICGFLKFIKILQNQKLFKTNFLNLDHS